MAKMSERKSHAIYIDLEFLPAEFHAAATVITVMS